MGCMAHDTPDHCGATTRDPGMKMVLSQVTFVGVLRRRKRHIHRTLAVAKDRSMTAFTGARGADLVGGSSRAGQARRFHW
jgi:hypothetical protein